MRRIDIEKLRDDIKDMCYGAFFSGRYGAALMECVDAESASPEELIKIAQGLGIRIEEYAMEWDI